MKCKYLKYRSKKGTFYNYCSLQKKEISAELCRGCIDKSYKEYKTLKNRTYKQNKKEKERFSIIFPDLTKCCKCGSKIGIQKHEVIYGSNRQNSIKYGLVIPLCYNHHIGADGIHYDKNLDNHFHILAQKLWEQKYGNRDEFIKIFGRSWIK